jgi:hypothetical protein
LHVNNAAFLKQDFNFCWCPTLEVGTADSEGRSVSMHSSDVPDHLTQLVNHFANLRILTTKTGLINSLIPYAAKSNVNVFDITPTTFIIKMYNVNVDATVSPKKRSMNNKSKEVDISWEGFLEKYHEIKQGRFERERVPEYHCSKNMWIVKPSGLNCGRGIHVFQDLNDIKRFVEAEKKGVYVIQKYLEQPLLLWGRKFDMRIWVTVNESGKVFMYRNGYLRTSSEKFTLDLKGASFGDKQMVHLTNYCMQKNSENLGKFEDGNTLSFDDFQKYLDEFHGESRVDVREHIGSYVYDIAIVKVQPAITRLLLLKC